MSLLSGLFTELEKAPAPRFVLSENVERTTAPAEQLDQRQQPGAERTPKCKKRPTVAETPHTRTPAPIHTPQPVADPDQPQHFIQTAVTASTGWCYARDQYINHLMACRGCYAPASRYCAAGAELRQRYEQTPMA